MNKRIEDIFYKMLDNPKGIRFSELFTVCEYYFGKPRNSGSSHYVFKMPWAGDPRLNIQSRKGKAKSYQVKQAILAIYKFKGGRWNA